MRDEMSDDHSRYPVEDDDGKVLGVLHVKDLLRVDDRDDAVVDVAALIRDPMVLPEVAYLKTVLDQMRGENTEMAILIDEYGAPAGVVTLEDLIEELVGEIADEYDGVDDEPHVADHPDGTYTFPANMRVSEINRATGADLPDDESVDTISGLVLLRLQHIPKVGESVTVADTLLTVESMEGWALGELRLTHLPEGSDTASPGHASNADAAGEGAER